MTVRYVPLQSQVLPIDSQITAVEASARGATSLARPEAWPAGSREPAFFRRRAAALSSAAETLRWVKAFGMPAPPPEEP